MARGEDVRKHRVEVRKYGPWNERRSAKLGLGTEREDTYVRPPGQAALYHASRRRCAVLLGLPTDQSEHLHNTISGDKKVVAEKN